MSHHKNIETSREARLWVGVAVSVATLAMLAASNPYLQDKGLEVKNNVKKMAKNVTRKIRVWKETHSKKIEIEKKP